MPEAAAWPPGEGEMATRVRELDWGATQLGPSSGWPQSLRTAVDMILAMPSPATVLWGPAGVQIYNDAYLTIARDRHPDLLGRPVAEGWSDAYERAIAPLIRSARAGNATQMRDYPVPLHSPSGAMEERFFDSDWVPLRDETGEVAGSLQTISEVTERRRTAKALARSESRFKALATAGAVSVYRMSPDWTLMYQLDSRNFLANTVEPTAGWIETYILPEDRAWVSATIAEAIETRSIFELEHRVRLADGSIGWVMSRAVPMIDSNGEIGEWFGAATNVTDRKRAEAVLRDSEERFREFGDASSDVIWTRDAETLCWTYLSRGFEAIYGVSCGDALENNNFRNWAELIVPEDREHAVASIKRVRDGERVAFEYRIRRPDGGIRWLRNTDFPIRDNSGRIVRIGGIGTDITALKAAEEHQRMLLAELQHRVRNTLAMVRSIARRTGENSRTVDQMTAHLVGRLDAFSRVQAAVTRSAAGLVDLASLIEDEIIAHAAREGEQVVIEGPDIALEPKAAERLSLAIHELTTNAVKHGALVGDRGRIAIRWRQETGEQGPLLRLNWRESGLDAAGDGVKADGFGMELLRHSLPYDLDGQTRVELRADGLNFELCMPLKPRPELSDGRAAQVADPTG